jgi:hypothetical protein
MVDSTGFSQFCITFGITEFFSLSSYIPMLGGIPVPTAWRVLGLRMEERPPDMEVSCKYIE